MTPVNGYRTWGAAAWPAYEALRVLGSGAMGTVVLARDRELGRLVALKFLRETCAQFLERFRREARIMARLAHPAIVPVHEFRMGAPRPFLALGYVDGGNLGLARLEPRELVRTLRGIVDALAFAHAQGIVHRDVKPENVLLDRRGRAFLTDFGLALEPGEGKLRGPAGTPLTMSPEQVRGRGVGPASDQFSFGATLYRQLTGEWPFRGRTLIDVLLAIEHEPPRRPRALVPALPRALESIVLRCLRKEPAERFRSMTELGVALDRFLERRALLPSWLPRRRTRPPPQARIHPPSLHPEQLP